MALTEKYCILDLETGGLGPHGEEVIEVAATRVDENGESASFCERVKPRVPVDPATSAIHNMRTSDLSSCRAIGEVVGELMDFVDGYTWIVYNAPFDVPIIYREAKLAGRAPEEGLAIDLYRVAASLDPDMPSHTLQYMFHAYELPRPTDGCAHSAMYDVTVTRELLDFICWRNGISSLEKLMEISLRPIPVEVVKFGKHKGEHLSDIPDSYIDWWLNKRETNGTDDNIDFTYNVVLEANRRARRAGRREMYNESDWENFVEGIVAKRAIIGPGLKEPVIRR